MHQTDVDRGLNGRPRLDVDLSRPQVDVVLRGVGAGRLELRRIAPLRASHAGIDRMPGVGELARGQSSKTRGRAGDDDGLAHGEFLFFA
jgi:hypothetical protein